MLSKISFCICIEFGFSYRLDLDQDPDSVNTDPQHWFKHYGINLHELLWPPATSPEPVLWIQIGSGFSCVSGFRKPKKPPHEKRRNFLF
jgi:hypothetical protein